MKSRKFEEDELVIATHNPGKVREIAELLEGRISKFYSAGELNLPEPEETGDTFEENALIKARASAQASGKAALADDSGLCIDAFDGDPGIFSARWAGPDKDFNVAMEKIHKRIDAMNIPWGPENKAQFVCALALVWPDGHEEVFTGKAEGYLSWPPKGKFGFGYDPIFCTFEDDFLTFAEMHPQEKHLYSHRKKAFDKLVQSCFS